MKPLSRNTLKLLCWGLALLALAQPVLSLDCACVCDAHREDIPASDEISVGHCHDSGLTCCHHDHADRSSDDVSKDSESLSLLGLVVFHNCRCPSDCDCQWQHRGAQAVVVSSKASNHASPLAASFSGGPYVTAPPLQELSASSREQEAQLAVSAQAACALLCRFLS